MKKIKFNKKYFLIFSIIIIAVWCFIIDFLSDYIIDSKYENINKESYAISNEISTILESKLLVFDLISNEIHKQILINKTIDKDYFDEYGISNDIIDKGFVNFTIAPNGVFEYVFPLEGNEMLLGEDLINDDREKVRLDVLHSIESGELIVSGPIELIRGGVGLIIREPIYIEDEFWGFVSSVVDISLISVVLDEYNKSDINHYALINEENKIIYGENLEDFNCDWKARIDLEEVDLYVIGNLSKEIGLLSERVIISFRYFSIFIIILLMSFLYWVLNLNLNLSLKLQRMIYYDTLTLLPNRRLLNKNLKELIMKKTDFYLAFIDLDDFKDINDSLGHTFGDEILKAVSKRFVSSEYNYISAFRWGGDEFVLIFENMDKTSVIKIIDEIIQVFKKPVVVEDSEFVISLSIGIVSYPTDSTDGEDLIKKADMLMYSVKDTFKNNYKFYEKDFEIDIVDNIEINNKMKSSKFINDLVVYYQPKLNVSTNKIVGMEALVRWKSDDKLIMPDKFILIAEKNGKIKEIDKYVIKTAFAQTKLINESREIPLKIAVNVSGINLNNKFIEYIKEQIDIIGINPKNVEIEITENVDINYINEVINMLLELVDYGTSIAIDDFGKGYAALNYLLKFPASTIKIDKEFIDNISRGTGSKIVNSIISLAHSLDKKAVAEGVETSEQLKYLNEINCDDYQGYLFSKPINIVDFKKILENEIK